MGFIAIMLVLLVICAILLGAAIQEGDGGFVPYLLIAIIGLGGILIVGAMELGREAEELKTACEQNLPRSQECKMVFVPQEVEK